MFAVRIKLFGKNYILVTEISCYYYYYFFAIASRDTSFMAGFRSNCGLGPAELSVKLIEGYVSKILYSVRLQVHLLNLN